MSAVSNKDHEVLKVGIIGLGEVAQVCLTSETT